MQTRDIILLIIISKTHAAILNRHDNDEKPELNAIGNDLTNWENQSKFNLLIDTANNNADAEGIEHAQKSSLNQRTKYHNIYVAEKDARKTVHAFDPNRPRDVQKDDKKESEEIVGKREKGNGDKTEDVDWRADSDTFVLDSTEDDNVLKYKKDSDTLVLDSTEDDKILQYSRDSDTLVLDSTENGNVLKNRRVMKNRVKRNDDDIPWIWATCPDGEHHEVTDGRLYCVVNHEGECQIGLDLRANFGAISCPSNMKRYRLGNRDVCLKRSNRRDIINKTRVYIPRNS